MTGQRPCFDCGGPNPTSRYYCDPCMAKRNRRYRARKVLDGRADVLDAASRAWYRAHASDPKRCLGCGENKLVRDFHRGNGFRGVKTPCKDCCRRERLARYGRNRAHEIEMARARDAQRVRGRQCPCGKQKAPGAAACPGCLRLDGWSRGTQAIISALRVCGGSANTDALATESGYAWRHVLRICAEMLRAGRVRRVVEDGEGESENDPRTPTWILTDDRPASASEREAA